MVDFYHVIVWVLFGSLLLIVLWVLFQLTKILLQNSTVLKKIYYAQRQFNSHYKNTDKTVVDTRKERDFWKKKATKSA